MANIILTRPKSGSGAGGLANTFETILADSGSVTAVGSDTLVISGGFAITTSASTSPKSVVIDVNPSEINLDDLGDVSTGSPITTGYVLSWNGSEWVPVDPTAAASGITEGPGISITSSGSPPISTISLDICSLPTGPGSPSTLGLDDEIAVCDGSTNYKYTLLDVAEILPFATTLEELLDVSYQGSPQPKDGDVIVYRAGSPGGWVNEPQAPGNDLEIRIINGQPMLTFLDTTRSSGSPASSPPNGKRLSVAEQAITFAENALTINDWVRIGNSNDADNGYIADFDGTVTFATAHCEDTGANSKDIHLFINGTDEGAIGTLSGGADVSFINTTLNIDFARGDKIRLQAQQGSGGGIGDTVVKLTLKWRS